MVSLVNFISSKRVLDFRNRSVGVVLLHGEIALHIVKSMLHIYAVRTPCSGVNLDNGRKITQVHGAHRRGVRFGGLATKDGPRLQSFRSTCACSSRAKQRCNQDDEEPSSESHASAKPAFSIKVCSGCSVARISKQVIAMRRNAPL